MRLFLSSLYLSMFCSVGPIRAALRALESHETHLVWHILHFTLFVIMFFFRNELDSIDVSRKNVHYVRGRQHTESDSEAASFCSGQLSSGSWVFRRIICRPSICSSARLLTDQFWSICMLPSRRNRLWLVVALPPQQVRQPAGRPPRNPSNCYLRQLYKRTTYWNIHITSNETHMSADSTVYYRRRPHRLQAYRHYCQYAM